MTSNVESRLQVEYDIEVDGRWIAEVREVPGAMAYGRTRAEARNRALAIAAVALGRPPAAGPRRELRDDEAPEVQ